MNISNEHTEKSSAALRTLSILETIANSASPITATEIIQILGLPKPTVHRLCSMLENEGYLQVQLDGRGYLPGKRLSSLAIGVISNNDLFRSERHAILKELSEDIGETCNISAPDGLEMIYFDRVETHWPLRIQLNKNDRVPMYCTASGKLYLNQLYASKRNRLLSKFTYQQHTNNTITETSDLKIELQKLSLQGIGIDNEEFIQGMVAIAVPLKDNKDHFYGALAVHAPTARMSIEQIHEWAPRLRQAATELVSLILE